MSSHSSELSAHVSLVVGVGARPVLKVGDEGGRVGVEDGGGQALAPRDWGAEVTVGVGTVFAETLAHKIGVGVDGGAAGEVDGALDVGGGNGSIVDDGILTSTYAP